MEATVENSVVGGNLVVRRGRVHTPQGFLENSTVVIAEGRIAYVGCDNDVPTTITSPVSGKTFPVANMPVLDAEGCVVAPGLLDVHTHGGAGADVMDATVDALRTMAQAHGRHGTVGLLASAVTASQEALEAVAHAVNEAMPLSLEPEWNGSQIIGLHLEGPYMNTNKKGAQHAGFMRPPSRAELERIFAIIGKGFKHITLAPELPNALEVIGWLRDQGVRVSMGHTEASYDLTLEAIATGADHATHGFNAMPSLHHREPGVLGAVLGDDRVTSELIADGIHVHPGAMRVMYKAKGPCLTCLVTDAIEAMDMPPGMYELGGLPVEVKDGACRLVNGGSLAGSILTLDRAVKNVVEMVDVPLHEAIEMATAVPARQMRIQDRKGSLEEGKDGDLCVFGPDLLCRDTVVAGRLLRK